MSYYSDQVLALNPSVYWRLNETSSTMTDLSGNGRHGTVNGSPTRGVAGALPSTDTDLAIDLRGGANGDFVSHSYNPWATGSSRTFIGWFKQDTAGRGGLFGYTQGPRLEIGQPTNNDDIQFSPDWAVTNTTWTHAWPSTGAWHFVALTFVEGGGANNVSLYIDGALISTQTNAGTYAASKQFRAGTWHNSGVALDFDGKMDEVAVFPTILNSTQIANLYAAGLTAQISPPIAVSTAAGLAPSVAADANLDGAQAAATAAALVPDVSANFTLSAVEAAATAAALVPSVTVDVTIAALVAQATASALVPALRHVTSDVPTRLVLSGNAAALHLAPAIHDLLLDRADHTLEIDPAPGAMRLDPATNDLSLDPSEFDLELDGAETDVNLDG